MLTLYGVVLFTGLRIAGQARDRLGKLMAVGVVDLLFSHVFINIGMNIRIVPVTGIPLPLLILRRVISAGLVDRHWHPAKRLYVSKGLLTMSERNFSGAGAAACASAPAADWDIAKPQRTDRDASQARAEVVGEHAGAGKSL